MSLLFLLLIPLSDVVSIDPAAVYDHAQQLFVHGYLDASQREAEQAYKRFVYADAGWARRFLLLEASSMAWRGLYDDLLTVLADDRVSWQDSDGQVERRALQVRAMTKLHRFPEAVQSLAQGEAVCARTSALHCAYLLRARGMLFVERGDLVRGKQDIQASLVAARQSGDRMMEGQALLNLGYIASQQELHDEAAAFYRAAREAALKLGSKNLEQVALGDEGWEQSQLGNPEKGLALFDQARTQAVSLGDRGNEIVWLSAEAVVYRGTGQLGLAESTGLRAIELARRINDKQAIIDASMDLAQTYVESGKPDKADQYSDQALSMAQETGSELDLLNVRLIQGQASALRHDWARADRLLHEVVAGAGSQDSMRWDAQRSLGNIYEAQGDTAGADRAYRGALGLIEGTRASLKQEESRLTFLSKATRIYDDYIHFLVANGKTEEALEAADWSRARTLQQGLGLIPSGASTAPPGFHAVDIARKTNSTLLFYWLGERQSYLWAVSLHETSLVPLPAKSGIVQHVQRYRRAILDLKEPLKESNRDGRALYEMLVAPAAKMVAPGGRVVLFADGELSELNFETLITDGASPHFWIEDVTILSAPSIRMFAAKTPPEKFQGKLLLLGDSISPGMEFPPLPMAPVEVQKIQPQFTAAGETVFTRERATPSAYLNSNPEQYTYIHFVSHGTASRTDPLDSAVVLSPENGAGDDYKLRARDILKRPINARLVTVSACDSSGARSVAGEGLVGVSWAFLRAGAHNAIGALWDVSDASTPELMDRMYIGLQQGKPPADALRDAKLSLVHSGGKSAKPFYWAPFQLYAGR